MFDSILTTILCININVAILSTSLVVYVAVWWNLTTLSHKNTR